MVDLLGAPIKILCESFMILLILDVSTLVERSQSTIMNLGWQVGGIGGFSTPALSHPPAQSRIHRKNVSETRERYFQFVLL